MAGSNVVKDVDIPWVPLRAGMWMRPMCFLDDGYSLQLRVSPGVRTGLHRHTGAVDSLTLSGRRRIYSSDEMVGPGCFVHEPAGNEDDWGCEGDEDCIIQITLKGRVEYLNADGEVDHYTDTSTAQAVYLGFCREAGLVPEPSLFRGSRRIEER